MKCYHLNLGGYLPAVYISNGIHVVVKFSPNLRRTDFLVSTSGGERPVRLICNRDSGLRACQ